MGLSDHLRAHLSAAPELLDTPTLAVNLAMGTNGTGLSLQDARSTARVAAVASWHAAVEAFRQSEK